jgi:hypothetical protein
MTREQFRSLSIGDTVSISKWSKIYTIGNIYTRVDNGSPLAFIVIHEPILGPFTLSENDAEVIAEKV